MSNLQKRKRHLSPVLYHCKTGDGKKLYTLCAHYKFNAINAFAQVVGDLSDCVIWRDPKASTIGYSPIDSANFVARVQNN